MFLSIEYPFCKIVGILWPETCLRIAAVPLRALSCAYTFFLVLEAREHTCFDLWVVVGLKVEVLICLGLFAIHRGG